MLERFQKDDPLISLEPVANPDQIIHLQQMRKEIRISAPIRNYITDIVAATRNAGSLRFGSSPRGSLGLMRASQGLAALKGRDYVLPDDIKQLVLPVLTHRIILNEEARLGGEDPEQILTEIISRIPVQQ